MGRALRSQNQPIGTGRQKFGEKISGKALFFLLFSSRAQPARCSQKKRLKIRKAKIWGKNFKNKGLKKLGEKF